MTALAVAPLKPTVEPINMPRLRAVKDHAPLDIPALTPPREEAPRVAPVVPAESVPSASVLDRVESGIKLATLVAGGGVVALLAQLWVTVS